jgi:hypothetical protein
VKELCQNDPLKETGASTVTPVEHEMRQLKKRSGKLAVATEENK